MNRVLEIINKEREIKKHRRKLTNENNSKKIAELESEVSNKNCDCCKKKLLSNDNSKFSWSHTNSEGKKTFFCSSECLIKGAKEIGKGQPKQNENNQIKDFSRAYLLAGNEFNQELEQLAQKELKSQISFIDFNFHYNGAPEFIEKKIKEIYNNSQNQKLIEEEKFPIICFKNSEKIKRNQNLEEALLPVFDKQQNSELFHGEVNLSNFIILVTTSTPEIGDLSDPLISRLDVVNVDTVQTKQPFLDKYYYWFLVPSILINLILITLILWPKFIKKVKK